MRKLITLLFALIILVPLNAQVKTYLIKGTVINSPNLQLEYNDWETNRSEPIVIKDGKFEIKGELTGGTFPRTASISIVEGKSRRGNTVILEPGEITVTFTGKVASVGGTNENVKYEYLTQQLKKLSDAAASSFYDWQKAYDNKASEKELNNIWMKSESAKQAYSNETLKILKANDCFASLTILPRISQYEGAKALEPFIKMFEKYSYTNTYQYLKKHYDAMTRCTDGAPVKNFILPAPDGKMVSLEDFRGKWVLLDFWYVDCPWCRKLTPNLGKIYPEYKNKGLEIISISVDNVKDRDRMLKVIADEKMVWTQVNDTTKKVVPDYFGVTGYPTIYLIDPQGRGQAMKVGYCEAAGLRSFLDKYINYSASIKSQDH